VVRREEQGRRLAGEIEFGGSLSGSEHHGRGEPEDDRVLRVLGHELSVFDVVIASRGRKGMMDV
jgi:hypothetical protein